MKFTAIAAAVFAVAGTGSAAPADAGQCEGMTGNGQWLACPMFYIPPGSPCKTIPEDRKKIWPDCCPHPSCPSVEAIENRA
ncbi:hypothetical protein MY10362_006037 [Beauveria mimosiformis]